MKIIVKLTRIFGALAIVFAVIMTLMLLGDIDIVDISLIGFIASVGIFLLKFKPFKDKNRVERYIVSKKEGEVKVYPLGPKKKDKE